MRAPEEPAVQYAPSQARFSTRNRTFMRATWRPLLGQLPASMPPLTVSSASGTTNHDSRPRTVPPRSGPHAVVCRWVARRARDRVLYLTWITAATSTRPRPPPRPSTWRRWSNPADAQACSPTSPPNSTHTAPPVRSARSSTASTAYPIGVNPNPSRSGRTSGLKVTNEQQFPAISETPTRLVRSRPSSGLTRELVRQEGA